MSAVDWIFITVGVALLIAEGVYACAWMERSDGRAE